MHKQVLLLFDNWSIFHSQTMQKNDKMLKLKEKYLKFEIFEIYYFVIAQRRLFFYNKGRPTYDM